MKLFGMSLSKVNPTHAVNQCRMSKRTWEGGSGVSGATRFADNALLLVIRNEFRPTTCILRSIKRSVHSRGFLRLFRQRQDVPSEKVWLGLGLSGKEA